MSGKGPQHKLSIFIISNKTSNDIIYKYMKYFSDYQQKQRNWDYSMILLFTKDIRNDKFLVIKSRAYAEKIK